MITPHGLSEVQLEIIQKILVPFASSIDMVGLFGSRATGCYRPSSDIDMVLYGTVDEKMVDRIATLFQESLLPMKVDVLAYHLINYPALKAHIDKVMLPLLTREALQE